MFLDFSQNLFSVVWLKFQDLFDARALGVYLGYNNGAYSNPTVYPGETPLVTKDTMESWLRAHWTDAELEALYAQLSTIGGGAAGAAIRNGAANVFNAEAGLDLLPV